MIRKYVFITNSVLMVIFEYEIEFFSEPLPLSNDKLTTFGYKS